MRVLLIEDDSATAQSIELMLKSEGFNVYTTDLGEEGVDLGKLYDYDIILLDLNLPDMNGFEVLKTLRLSKIATPILILSGLAGIENKVRGLGLRRRRLHDQALPQGRAHRAHSRGGAPLQGPFAVGHSHGQAHRQSRHQDRRGERRPRASDRQGISDARAPLLPQGHDAHQGDVPEPSLWRHGRARAQDHRRLHLQAAQEARRRHPRRALHRDRVGPGLCAPRSARKRSPRKTQRQSKGAFGRPSAMDRPPTSCAA